MDNISEIDIKTLKIHQLAESTPKYSNTNFQALLSDIELNGQQTPIVVLKDMIIDGRHRFLALNELNSETIKVSKLPNNTTDLELEKIIHSYETRRHETASQLAIKALYDYLDVKTTGTLAHFATKHGASLANIGRANKIGGTRHNQFKRLDILDLIFNGEKFQIEDHIETDSLAAIEGFLKKQQLNRKQKSTGIKLDCIELSDNEQDIVDAILIKVQGESDRVKKALINSIYPTLSKITI